MESQSEHGPVTSFLMRLGEDEQLMSRWADDPKKALEGQGLSQDDQDLLAGGDFAAVRERVMKESQSQGGAAPYMLIYMRS